MGVCGKLAVFALCRERQAVEMERNGERKNVCFGISENRIASFSNAISIMQSLDAENFHEVVA